MNTRVVYLDAEMRREIDGEAARLDRSRSWLLQKAWTLARDRIRQMPAPRPPSEPRPRRGRPPRAPGQGDARAEARALRKAWKA